eukprot:jgi/Tetstr1/464233/TSEL_009038.t1
MSSEEEEEERQRRRSAEHVRRSLALLKDKIGRNQAQWDVYKIACNPYELVYTAPPCVVSVDGERKHPISRAFYKMWEIVCDDDGIRRALLDPRPKSFAYVAEAPGSFVEAVVTFRETALAAAAADGRPRDRHRGITVGSDRRSVPHWKLQWPWMRAFGVGLCRGADGTGDVTRLANIAAFVRDCGGDGSCDMVTGDGGFDFSSNFNEQEAQMTRLLAAEVLVAMRLLRRGGCAVIKVFDAFNPDTVELLAAFVERFERHDIRKPSTSRPANSERYVVCSGYTGQSLDACQTCERYIAGRGDALDLRASPQARRFVAAANMRHCLAQLECIIDTFDAMDRGDQSSHPDRSGEWTRDYITTGPTAARTPA